MNPIQNSFVHRALSIVVLGGLTAGQIIAPAAVNPGQEQIASATTNLSTAQIKSQLREHSNYYFVELPKSNFVLQADKEEVQAAANLDYKFTNWLSALVQLRSPMGNFTKAQKAAFVEQAMSDFERYVPNQLRTIRRSQIQQPWNEEAKNNRFDGLGVYYYKYNLFMNPEDVVEVNIDAWRKLTKIFVKAVANTDPYLVGGGPSDEWWSANLVELKAAQTRWMEFQAMEMLLSLAKSIWQGDAYNASTNTEVFNIVRRTLELKNAGRDLGPFPTINWLTGEGAPRYFLNVYSPFFYFPVNDNLRANVEKGFDKDLANRILPMLEGVGAHSIEELRKRGFDLSTDTYYLLSNAVGFALDAGLGDDAVNTGRASRSGSSGIGSIADEADDALRASRGRNSGAGSVADEADDALRGRNSSSNSLGDEADEAGKKPSRRADASDLCSGGYSPVAFTNPGTALYASFQTMSYTNKQSALEKVLGGKVVSDYPVAGSDEDFARRFGFEDVRTSSCYYQDFDGNEVNGDAIKLEGGEYKIIRRNSRGNRIDWDVNAGSFEGAIDELNKRLGVDLRKSGIDWDNLLEYKQQGVMIDIDDFAYTADDITLRSTTDDSTGVAFDLYRNGERIGELRYHANGHSFKDGQSAANPQNPHFNLNLDIPMKKVGRQKIDVDGTKMHIFYSN